jgi:acyl-coenzyme A thioesterase PaaI-like protein
VARPCEIGCTINWPVDRDQPRSGLAAVLPLDFELESRPEDGARVAKAGFPANGALAGISGVVHGGLLMAALDETMGVVAIRPNERNQFVTAMFSTRFRRPILIDGSQVHLVAWCSDFRDRARRVHATISHGGQLCVEAEAVFARFSVASPDK